MSVDVLLVDRAPAARQLLARALANAGFRVTTVASAEEALYEHARHDVDVVLTALELGGMDGVELCRVLKEQSRVPVIVIERGELPPDMVLALDAGADDVVGAARPEEIVARIRAVLRRHSGSLRPRRQVRVGELVAEWSPGGRLRLLDARFALSPVEGTVLEVLAERPGCVVPADVLRERLIERHGPGSAVALEAALARLGVTLAEAGAGAALQHLPEGGWLLAS